MHVDDFLLMLADKEPCVLQNRTNNRIKLINIWLREKKLISIFTKTNFMIFNKRPKKSVSDMFTIRINDIKMARVYKANYLDLSTDDALNR